MCLLIACLTALSFGVPAPTQDTHAIGARGAALELDGAWKPKIINPALGEDQFLGSGSVRNMFLVVLEFEAFLEEETDYRNRLAIHAAGIEAAGENSEAGEVTFEDRDGVGHAHQLITAEIASGVELTYYLHLVGRDGLGYLIIMWAADRTPRKLRTAGEEVVAGLSFPVASSEWGRSALTHFREVRFAGHTLRVRVRDSVFHDEFDTGDAFLGLMTAAEEIVLLFLPQEGGDTLDAALDLSQETLASSFDGLVETSRSDAQVAGREARQALCTTADGIVNFQLLAVRLSPELILDLRILYDAPQSGRAAMRAAILDSIEIDGPKSVDAFPEVAAAPEPPRTSPRMESLLRKSKLLGWIPEQPAQLAFGADEELIVATGRGIAVLKPGAREAESLFQDSGWLWSRKFALTGATLLTVAPGGMVQRVAEGLAQPTDFDATALAAAPDGALFLTRTAKTERIPGLELSARDGPDVLIHRRAGGDEVVIASFPDQATHALAIDAAVEWALVQGAPASGESGTSLTVIDLGTGASHEAREWASVFHLGSAETGWLVTGQPWGGPLGIYRLAPDGAHELLLSGAAWMGIASRADTLFVTTRLWLEGDVPPPQMQAVYAVPARAIATAGPLCAPFHGDLLQSIGEETLRVVGHDLHDVRTLATEASLRSFLDRADEISQRMAGRPLPASMTGLDELLDILSSGGRPGHAGALVATALTARALLDAGARWVDGGAHSAGALEAQAFDEPSNAFAVAALPARTVLDALGGEAYETLVDYIVDNAAGRTILVGTDPAALREALVRTEDAQWRTIAREGEASDLIELLGQNLGNVYLRDEVYGELAIARRMDELLAVATHFAASAGARGRDVRVRFAALAALEEGEPQPQRISDLRKAIAEYPAEAGLYLLLGHAYEGSPSIEDHVDLARACFEKTRELIPWGPLADDADEALARL